MESAASRVSYLELRQLRYVLLLTELRSLRRAAAHLALPARAFNREIARVERTLGTRLFERLPRRIVPTAAGREIAEIARRALSSQIAEPSVGSPAGASLRVGWMDFGRGQAVQRAALTEFRAQHPHVSVHLVPSLFRDQLQDVADDVLDVAFYTGEKPHLPRLNVELLLPDTVGSAMLPSGHPLASAEELSLDQLSGLPFHSLRMDYAPEIMAGLHDSVARAGWRGRQTTGSSRPSEVITAVACGAGWAPAPSDLVGWAPPGVTVLPLADGPLMGVDLYVMWRDDDPAAHAFVNLVFEMRDVIEAPASPPGSSGRAAEAGYGALLAQRYAERARVARDLHDTLLQEVSGSELRLEALRRRLPPELKHENREIGLVVETLERAVRAGREVLRKDRAAHPGGRDLAGALTGAAASLGAGSAAEFELETTGSVRALRGSVEDAAARIGTEAVGNAFRHACASRISATLDYWDDVFRLRVRDDGVGIDPAVLEAGGREYHLGLPLMKERAAAVGATLTVESGAGAGTVVEMVVPGHLAFAM